MNIAIFNAVADIGSTGMIARGLQKYLNINGHNAYIFCRDKENGDCGIYSTVNKMEWYLHVGMTRLFGGEGTYSHNSTQKVIKKLEELSIEAVVLINIHGYFLNLKDLLEWTSSNNIKVEQLMIDESAFTGKCCYTFDCDRFKQKCEHCPEIKQHPKSLFLDKSTYLFDLKNKLYNLNENMIFTGVQYTVKKAKESAIMKDRKFLVADEAIDLDLYYPRNTTNLRKELKIPERNKIIVTIIPYPDERKGGQYFLETARRMENEDGYTFVHVGFNGDKSICPKNYIAIGFENDQDKLSEYYSLGDLFIHPSKAETICLTVMEALACGTPILAFNISGMPYSCDSKHGTFVEYGNVDELINIIKKTDKKTNEISDSCRKYAEIRYNQNDYYKKILNALTK